MIGSMVLLYSIASFVTSPYIVWFPVVMSGTLAIIGVLVLIYMFSSSIGREDIRVRAKAKIYEVAISILLIFAFLIIATIVTSLNFEMMLAPAGLVPSACQDALDMFSLAICNLHTFNGNVLNLNWLTYWAGVVFSLVPKLKVNGERFVELTTQIKGVGPTADVTLIPNSYDSFIGYLLPVMYFAFMLSQTELLILEASLIFFSMFMAIGLIARIFVVTRSFGGSMIAIGMGLGMLYPLLACVTYGYINVGLEANSVIFVGSTPYLLVLGLAMLSISIPLMPVASVISTLVGVGVSTYQTWLASLVIFIGLTGTGLLLIPFLNFLIIDVFVIDFSRAIGERMDFMKLLTGIV